MRGNILTLWKEVFLLWEITDGGRHDNSINRAYTRSIASCLSFLLLSSMPCVLSEIRFKQLALITDSILTKQSESGETAWSRPDQHTDALQLKLPCCLTCWPVIQDQQKDRTGLCTMLYERDQYHPLEHFRREGKVPPGASKSAPVMGHG